MPFSPRGAAQNHMTIIKFSELHDHARTHRTRKREITRPLKCDLPVSRQSGRRRFRLQNFHWWKLLKCHFALKVSSLSLFSYFVILLFTSHNCSQINARENNKRSNGGSISYCCPVKSQFVQCEEWRYCHATLVIGYSVGNFADVVRHIEAIFLARQYTSTCSSGAISKGKSRRP